MVTISWAVTVKDELDYVKNLLPILHKGKRENDEIVVLFDDNNGSRHTYDYLNGVKEEYGFSLHKDKFNGHFGEWKNKLTQLCKKDYIFQVDADEVPSEGLLENIHDLIEQNENIDVILVPRVNIVNGINDYHIKKWGWVVNSKGHINFPDLQWRVYKNNGSITWKNKVHEVLSGFRSYSPLPPYEELSLIHIKDILRQEKQNQMYSELQK